METERQEQQSDFEKICESQDLDRMNERDVNAMYGVPLIAGLVGFFAYTFYSILSPVLSNTSARELYESFVGGMRDVGKCF